MPHRLERCDVNKVTESAVPNLPGTHRRDRAATGDLSAELGASLRWRLSPLPNKRRRRRELLARVPVVLPYIADDIAANLVETLALELLDALEDLSSYRQLLTDALTLAHGYTRDIQKLRQQRHDLLNLTRGTR